LESKDGSNEEVFGGFSWGEVVRAAQGVRLCSWVMAVRWLVLRTARWFALSGAIAALHPWVPTIASQWPAARRLVVSSRRSSMLV
jgi:hypothetical protein